MLNYTAEILLEDKKRTCDRSLKTNRLVASGAPLKNDKLGEEKAQLYVVKMKHNVFNEKDKSKNCQNYPTARYKTYNQCDESFIRRFLAENYPQNFTPVWVTDDMTLVTTSMSVTNRSYGDIVDGTIVSDCPFPCRTTFVSTQIATEGSSYKDSSIEITFDQSVTVVSTDFVTFSMTDFLASIGGAAGLWLGVGVLQAGQTLVDFVKRVYMK